MKRIGIATLATLLLSCSSTRNQFPFESTQIMPQYPTQHIIHIKQMHGVSTEYLSHITREDVERIAAVQKEIYDIVLKLSHKYQTTSLYLEGVRDSPTYQTPESAAQFAEFFFKRELLNIHKAGLLCDSELSNLMRSVDDYIHGECDTLMPLAYYPGAAAILMMRRKVRIEPIEQRGILDNESRENQFIYRIAKKGHPYAILILGAGHSLEDNIETFNAQNPNRTIALTNIFPKSLGITE